MITWNYVYSPFKINITCFILMKSGKYWRGECWWPEVCWYEDWDWLCWDWEGLCWDWDGLNCWNEWNGCCCCWKLCCCWRWGECCCCWFNIWTECCWLGWKGWMSWPKKHRLISNLKCWFNQVFNGLDKRGREMESNPKKGKFVRFLRISAQYYCTHFLVM